MGRVSYILFLSGQMVNALAGSTFSRLSTALLAFIAFNGLGCGRLQNAEQSVHQVQAVQVDSSTPDSASRNLVKNSIAGSDIVPQNLAGKLDQTIFAATDEASFHLYHPDDLKHRLQSPPGWVTLQFACQPEFEAGRLVTFCTGRDGTFGFRITDGELTDREMTWLANFWSFRYVVRHGRVYLDGGYSLPCDGRLSKPEAEQWITIPNGNYRVIVNSIEWYSEPGAVDENGRASENSLTNYVIQFQPVDDLAVIESSKTPPWLKCSRDSKAEPTPDFMSDRDYEDQGSELADKYVIFVNKMQTPIPGYRLSITGPWDLYAAIFKGKGELALSSRIDELVIASSDVVPCVGALVRRSGASQKGDEPWELEFHTLRLVVVRSIEKNSKLPMGKVTALKRPESVVLPERLQELKDAFQRYVRVNENYRRNIKNPDFEAEYVEAMHSTVAVTHVLIHHIQIPLALKLKLLPLSDSKRVDQLLAILKKLTDK